GVRHSEFNAAPDASTHFLQIWILPSQQGIDPGYEQKAFADADKRGRLRVVASPDGRDGSLTVHADASLYAGLFDGDERAELPLAPGRLGYVHVARGALRVNGQALAAGDAALLRGESQVELGQGRNADVLVFDLAP
ncbi:MAG: pirin family protein, partial [Burkholderiales bacterium]